MRKVLLIVIVAAAAVAVWVAARQGDSDGAPEWRTAKVEREDLVVEVTATGALQPVTQVQVGTQVSGTIQELNADFNSRVTKGQIVAQIDPASFRAKVESDRANLLRAKADVLRVQALLKQAERDVERNGALVSDGLVTQQEYDAAVANRDSLLAQVDVSKASVTQQQATLAVSEVNLQYTTIVSPIDGVVISRNVDKGQTVAASLSAPTLFIIAADLKQMQVQAAVSEADIGRIESGQKVRFKVDAFPEEEFVGMVSQVRLASTTVQNVVTYTVLVDAPNPAERLLPGMTADLNFEIDHADDVLLVPVSALRFEPEEQGGKGEHGWGGKPRDATASEGGEHQGRGQEGHEHETETAAPEAGTGRVHVLRDGQLVAVDVQTGLSDGMRTAITGGDLKEGDEVVTGIVPVASAMTGTTNPFMPGRPSGGGGRRRG
ncbi:MAG TPA: efflux RND transporter periplasmic adaptor subunit [Planctomycetota bacterium]|nr:efflux RND transporter periplasmic adaptor subunit [Planctomycetota bacterium]